MDVRLLEKNDLQSVAVAATENPYESTASFDNQLPIRGGPLRFAVYLFGSIGFSFFSWAILLVLFFGDSSDLWPGYACGAVAIASCIGLAYLIIGLRLTTGRLFFLYLVLDFILVMFFIAYMFYWRIYIDNP